MRVGSSVSRFSATPPGNSRGRRGGAALVIKTATTDCPHVHSKSQPRTGHTRGKGQGKNTADENKTRSNQHRILRHTPCSCVPYSFGSSATGARPSIPCLDALYGPPVAPWTHRYSAVRRARPGPRDVCPGYRDTPAISHRIGVVRCPLAGRKGNGVSYTLQSLLSRLPRLQEHNSASRAALSPHEWDARLLGAARLIAQHPSVRQPMPDGGPIG